MALPDQRNISQVGQPGWGWSSTKKAAPVQKAAPIQNFTQTKQGTPVPTITKASPLKNYSNLINSQYDSAQSRIKTNQDEAQRSATENAQRAASIRGTAGAGFESKIQQQAVNEASKPYQDLSSSLDSERAGALVSAGQQQDQTKEQQRQFDISANLQRYAATNEMDLNKFSTFLNSITALKSADISTPSLYTNLFGNLKASMRTL